MELQKFLRDFGPGGNADNHDHLQRAVLTHAACTLMASDKNLTPSEAVGKVFEIFHQVHEVVQEAQK